MLQLVLDQEATMRPTTAPERQHCRFQLFPSSRRPFEHPRGVVSRPGLSFSGKRAILASWAPDATAIASCPSLRAPEGLKAAVTIDEILEALCALDGGPRQLHAGVAITVPWAPSSMTDRSCRPILASKTPPVTSIGIAQDNDRPTSPAP
ncbi:hypothetical protein [Bradyrhizobium sp. 25ACV]